MPHAQSVPAETISVTSAFGSRTRRRTIFTAIIDALHRSRRMQAERVLNQYRHLIDRSGRCIVCEATGHAGGEHEDK